MAFQLKIQGQSAVIKRSDRKLKNSSINCLAKKYQTCAKIHNKFTSFPVHKQIQKNSVIAFCQGAGAEQEKKQQIQQQQQNVGIQSEKELISDSGDGKGLPPSDGNGYGGDGDYFSDESGFESDGDEMLNLAQAEQIAQSQGVNLPSDFISTAQGSGLRAAVLSRYIQMQALFFTGFLMKSSPWFRDRLLIDSRFLFKVLAEITIDSGCATVAEVQKRGSEFWSEFEFYLSDMVVGIVLDIVLVGLLAPTAVLGARVAPAQTPLSKLLQKVPSAVFAPSVPGGRHFTLGGRLACLLVKGLEYSLAGIFCGFVGQGIANSCMYIRRSLKEGDDEDVPIPPLFQTALVWGMFMGLSSNIRYQIVYGLERLVEITIARKVPQVAYGTTVIIRLVNNFIGGLNFIDMARWAGVQ